MAAFCAWERAHNNGTDHAEIFAVYDKAIAAAAQAAKGVRAPIETAPRDGTVIQVGGPFEWVYAPGHLKNGSDFDLKQGKNFWREDRS